MSPPIFVSWDKYSSLFWALQRKSRILFWVLFILSYFFEYFFLHYFLFVNFLSTFWSEYFLSTFLSTFGSSNPICRSLSEDWINFYQKLNTVFLFLNAFNSVDTKCSYVFPSSSQLSSTFDDISLGPHGKTNVVKSSVSFAGSTWASIAASSARTAWVTFCWTSPGEMSSWCVCI